MLYIYICEWLWWCSNSLGSYPTTMKTKLLKAICPLFAPPRTYLCHQIQILGYYGIKQDTYWPRITYFLLRVNPSYVSKLQCQFCAYNENLLNNIYIYIYIFLILYVYVCAYIYTDYFTFGRIAVGTDY